MGFCLKVEGWIFCISSHTFAVFRKGIQHSFRSGVLYWVLVWKYRYSRCRTIMMTPLTHSCWCVASDSLLYFWAWSRCNTSQFRSRKQSRARRRSSPFSYRGSCSEKRMDSTSSYRWCPSWLVSCCAVFMSWASRWLASSLLSAPTSQNGLCLAFTLAINIYFVKWSS